MPAIQMGLGHVTDEKLGSRCVGTRIDHGKGTCFMLQFRGSLIIDFPARPAGTIAIGIATLGHESLYDAMENQSIVKARIRQMSEIGHCIGGILEEKLRLHCAFMGFDFHEHLLGLAVIALELAAYL